MPSAFNYINKAIATSNVSSLDFNSIPNTYEHLYLIVQARSTRNVGGTGSAGLRINGVTTSDYYWKGYVGNGTNYEGQSSSGGSSNFFIGYLPQNPSADNWEADSWSQMSLYIPIYKTTGPKMFQGQYMTSNNVGSTSAGYGPHGFVGGTYTPTSPISSLSIFSREGFNISAGSRAFLYGISI